ncbi:zinc finger protein 566 [Lingula anatina]|uniref:Zinc finger protein 566 n=1 Tax=Lingula anatina TaxID=7574 RepID=A0A1S3IUB6_LINAN|nr:zinc finger protein 566 [Lingula anatina]XP_013401125.1 zinc finger protein 566 [Lingula anatina]|eukprot:XP_013401124.1 zinc finger protein 566 [Lingula anatina]
MEVSNGVKKHPSGNSQIFQLVLPSNWINIGLQEERWKTLKDELKYESCERLVTILIDTYYKYNELISKPCVQKLLKNGGDNRDNSLLESEKQHTSIQGISFGQDSPDTRGQQGADPDDLVSSDVSDNETQSAVQDTRWHHKFIQNDKSTRGQQGSEQEAVQLQDGPNTRRLNSALSDSDNSGINPKEGGNGKTSQDGLKVTVDSVFSLKHPDLPISVTQKTNPNNTTNLKEGFGLSKSDGSKMSLLSTDKSIEKIRTDNELTTLYVCPVCPMRFWSLDLYKRHEKTHLYYSYQYKYCEETFLQLRGGKSHEKLQNEEKTYLCRYCGKTFSRRNVFREHERAHTGDKAYLCKHCGKAFTRYLYRNEHQRRHKLGSEKPFKCQVCSKTFAEKKGFKRHQRIHTGDRPHKCQFCEKTYLQRTTLINHERTHTGERPYKCRFCDKAFMQRATCNQHEKIHAVSTTYKCQICHKEFKNKNACVKHEMEHAP